MNFKKAICQIWGHDFALKTQSYYKLDEENKTVCTRCGKPKYMSFDPQEVKNDDASAMMFQNFNYMNSRAEFTSSRTLN